MANLNNISPNKAKKLVCCTLMNFSKSGGEVIRVSGILNALASRGVDITLYNPQKEIKELHGVTVKQLPESFSQLKKREFQFLLSHGDISATNARYKQLLQEASEIFKDVKENVLFFEYLDISIGYWLYRNDIIPGYYTDVHGINPLEFDLNETNSVRKAFVNRLKKYSVLKLDRKVYGNSKQIIYTSKGVKEYMENLYDLDSGKGLVVDESINNLLLKQEVIPELRKNIIEEYNIQPDETIVFFAGTFKEFGGIADLVKAYILLKEEYDLPTKLMLIGDGQLFAFCKKLVENSGLTDEIIFLGRKPYSQLKTYQSVADIIVCPDKDTPYSQILPHIKYFDSLASGSIVVNGLFEFTEEVNPNEKYSMDFIPSSVESLKDTLLRAIVNKDELAEKYEKASEHAIEVFNYDKSVEKLYEFIATR